MTLSSEKHVPVVCPADQISFGLGDRLGNASPAHLELFKDYNVFPVLAQQSKRELSLTDRTYKDIVDSAVEASEAAGWQFQFGADGDHLKTPEDIGIALDAGCSMITLDCSDEFPEEAPDANAYWDGLTEEKRALYLGFRESYRAFIKDANEQGMTYAELTEEDFRNTVAFYDKVADYIVDIYANVIKAADRDIDFEVSIDETPFETEPFAHWLIGGVLERNGIVAFSMAPRFVGHFEKGIDYRGDLDAFRASIAQHEAIAKHYAYRISVHSGSDKYAIFPIVADVIKRPFHIKTAGTHWLEAVRLVAEKDAELFRQFYKLAKDNFAAAKELYVIRTGLDDISDVSEHSEDQYAELLNDDDYRQFFHVNYGAILADKDAKDGLEACMKNEEERYHELLNINMKKHLDGLGIGARKA